MNRDPAAFASAALVVAFTFGLFQSCVGSRVSPEEVLLSGSSPRASWEAIELGGGGAVEWSEEALVLDFGAPLTGARFVGSKDRLPVEPYELEVHARRLAGSDFFLGLTVPVGDAFATVLLGGWGGSLCGLSCVDGEDASRNATKTFRGFEAGRTYVLRLRVDRAAVSAWLDGEPLFRQPRAGHAFSLRPEMEPCRPFGLAAYQTRAAVARVAWRAVRPGDATPILRADATDPDGE